MKFNQNEAAYYKILESGNEDLKAGKFIDAESKFDQAVNLKPTLFTAYNNRGCLNIFTEKYSVAIQDFDMAIKIAPHYDIAYINRGIAKLRSGESDGALNDFNKAIEIDPEPCNYEKRGRLKTILSDFAGAKEDFDLAKAKENEEGHHHDEVVHEPPLHYSLSLSLETH